MDETSPERYTQTVEGIKFATIDPCPASMWLLGAGAPCSLANGHDGPHEVTIKWSVGRA